MRVKFFTIPNILTLMNLLSGCMATLTAVSCLWSNGAFDLKVAFIFIIASAVFDFLDGFAARLLNQYSKLGVQLDSLADMVSFGLAPSIIMMVIFMQSGGVGAWYLLPLCIALCSALRLAKFNIDESQKESFEGLTTTANAIGIGSLGWFFTELGAVPISPSWVLAISLVLSWLLISPIKTFSFKFDGFSLSNKNNLLRYGFLAVSAAIIIIGGLGAIWWIIILYILTSIILNLCCSKRGNCSE